MTRPVARCACQKTFQARRRAKGLCVMCGTAHPGPTYRCVQCRHQIALAQKLSRLRLRREGRCIQCRAVKLSGVAFQRCLSCRVTLAPKRNKAYMRRLLRARMAHRGGGLVVERGRLPAGSA